MSLSLPRSMFRQNNQLDFDMLFQDSLSSIKSKARSLRSIGLNKKKYISTKFQRSHQTGLKRIKDQNQSGLKGGKLSQDFSQDEQIMEISPSSQENLLKLKENIFEEFITVLIKNFNPQQFQLQHLISLNENFTVFQRIFKKDSKDSLLIYGVKSTGKSASVDYALQLFTRYRKVVVNCHEQDSQVTFVLRLDSLLQNFFNIKNTIEMNFDNFEKKNLFAMIQPFIQKSSKKAVLVIQNAEILLGYKNHKVIYSLAQLASNCRQNVKLIFITKNFWFANSLDRKEKSRLQLLKLELFKFGDFIINLFKQRFKKAEKQIFSDENCFFSQYDIKYRNELFKITKQWFRKVEQGFCHNQSLKFELESKSRSIECHLNAVCWIMASLLQFGKVQIYHRKQIQKQVTDAYIYNLAEINSIPCRSLLINSNIDEKIFMAMVFSMIANERKPFNFKTILKLSYEFKAQKVEKHCHIFLTENCLKNAYLKLIAKRIIQFEEGLQNEPLDRQMKIFLNIFDIRGAIINVNNLEELPNFVKQILSL